MALALALTFTQIVGQNSSNDLNRAQEIQTYAETEKNIAEAQKLKLEIEALRKDTEQGQSVSTAEVNAIIERLQQVIAPLGAPSSASVPLILTTKYVSLSIVLIGFGLVTTILYYMWNLILSTVSNLIYPSSIRDEKISAAKRQARARRREKLQTLWRYALPLLSPVPAIVEWAVRLSIFGIIAIPLFDETAAYFGSRFRFADVARSFGAGEIGEALKQVHSILFGMGVT